MTEEELNRLEALANAATPGNRYAHGRYISVRGNISMTAYHIDELGQPHGNAPFQVIPFAKISDAEFIAASDPATITSLIRLARIGLAVTPRPISEAPKDGSPILAWRPFTEFWYVIFFADTEWKSAVRFSDAWSIDCFSHFIPLSALPKPGGDAPSKHHDWRISDSSLYDFKCRNCGSTDRSEDADLPCTKPGGE